MVECIVLLYVFITFNKAFLISNSLGLVIYTANKDFLIVESNLSTVPWDLG